MTTHALSESPRRRGAPSGNTNAIKHGFYSRKIRKSDLSGIEACDENNLSNEIQMLRVFIRRVVERGEDTDNISDLVSLLRVLCFATTSLTRMIRTQQLLGASGIDEIRQAIEDITKELELEDNLDPKKGS